MNKADRQILEWTMEVKNLQKKFEEAEGTLAAVTHFYAGGKIQIWLHMSGELSGEWEDWESQETPIWTNTPFRVKKEKTEYEWQWVYEEKLSDGSIFHTTAHFKNKEAVLLDYKKYEQIKIFERIEESKRVVKK